MRDSRVEDGGWWSEEENGKVNSLNLAGMRLPFPFSLLFLSLSLLTYLASRSLPTYIHFCPPTSTSAHPTPEHHTTPHPYTHSHLPTHHVTMALVNILNVEVLDNPAPFCNPFQFEITFECVAPLEDGMCSGVCAVYWSCDCVSMSPSYDDPLVLVLVALNWTILWSVQFPSVSTSLCFR